MRTLHNRDFLVVAVLAPAAFMLIVTLLGGPVAELPRKLIWFETAVIALWLVSKPSK
jgi:cytochrome P450